MAKKQKSARPDFTSHVKYEVLAGVFNVAELQLLNDAQVFRYGTFQAKAAELLERATGEKKAVGFFKSWDQIMDTILKHATSANSTENAVPNEEQGGADVVEDGDAGIAEALFVVEKMLSGDELDEEFIKSLKAEDIENYTSAMLRHLDTLEAGVRAQFEESVSAEGNTVANVVDIIKVSCGALCSLLSFPSLSHHFSHSLPLRCSITSHPALTSVRSHSGSSCL